MTFTPIRTLLTLTAAAAVLSACSTMAQPRPTAALHPVTVAETIERLELYARPDGLSLSARDRTAVAAFMQGYAASGNGALFINRPAGHMNGLGVQATDQLLSGIMREVGVSPSAAQAGEYLVRPGDPAPVVVSYATLRTVPQDCSSYGDMGDMRSNGVHPDFGCFHRANMAAMISDPRQLIAPLPQGVSNAQRRQVIYDRYIKGESTAAERPENQIQTSQETR